MVAALAVLVAIVALRSGFRSVDVVKKAAGILDLAEGVGKFINGACALVVPALAMTAAVTPLALIAGGLILLFVEGAGCRSSAPRWGCCSQASPRSSTEPSDVTRPCRTPGIRCARLTHKARPHSCTWPWAAISWPLPCSSWSCRRAPRRPPRPRRSFPPSVQHPRRAVSA